jgi:hypothetical protein
MLTAAWRKKRFLKTRKEDSMTPTKFGRLVADLRRARERGDAKEVKRIAALLAA